jgi:hypothetical protein
LLDNLLVAVQGSGEPTFDGLDVKFCRLIVGQLVQMREAMKIQAGLLKTLTERQEVVIEVLKDICDNVEGTDDPFGLFKDEGDEDAAGDLQPGAGVRRRTRAGAEVPHLPARPRGEHASLLRTQEARMIDVRPGDTVQHAKDRWKVLRVKAWREVYIPDGELASVDGDLVKRRY